jgi:hypothetical protein
MQGTQDASAGMTISGKKSECEGHKGISEVGMMNDEKTSMIAPTGRITTPCAGIPRDKNIR